MLRRTAAASRRRPTRSWCSATSPPHLLGGEIPLDRTGRARRHTRAGGGGRPGRRGVRGRRPRDRRLEPGQRDPPGHRQARARRARLRRLVAFGGSGPLTGVPADRHPRPADGVRPARPGQPQRVRAAVDRPARTITCRRSCSATTRSTLDELAGEYARLEADALARRSTARATPATGCASRSRRPALLRAGVRDPRARAGRRRSTPRSSTAVEARFHDAHERTYGYAYRDDPSQVVEWVNLRVTGVGPMERPTLHPIAAATGDPLLGHAPRSTSATAGTTRRSTPASGCPATHRGSRDDRGVRLDAADPPGLHGARRRPRQRGGGRG